MNAATVPLRVTRLELGAAMILALLAIGYPVWKGLIGSLPDVDFRYYWAAGHTWASGFDPYSPDYGDVGSSTIPGGLPIPVWFYPPNWWPICTALAMFEFHQSLMLFRSVSTLVFLGATGVLTGLLTSDLRRSRRNLLVCAACAVATMIESTGYILTSGQVSPVAIYAGLALLAVGQRLQRNGPAIAEFRDSGDTGFR